MRAYLGVISSTLDPHEVSQWLGVQPTNAKSSGEDGGAGVSLPLFHQWSLELEVPREVHFGTEGLSTAIESLGMPLAEKCAALGDADVSVTLQIVQNVLGGFDTDTTGIHLSLAALNWLSAAKVEIDIDQYFVSVDNEPGEMGEAEWRKMFPDSVTPWPRLPE